jgi:hypothetical protein
MLHGGVKSSLSLLGSKKKKLQNSIDNGTIDLD